MFFLFEYIYIKISLFSLKKDKGVFMYGHR